MSVICHYCMKVVSETEASVDEEDLIACNACLYPHRCDYCCNRVERLHSFTPHPICASCADEKYREDDYE